MSYKIGQFRRPQLSSYSNSLNDITVEYQPTLIITAKDITFYNICANLTGDSILKNPNCYYLRFKVKQRIDGEQTFRLKLIDMASSSGEQPVINREQLIDEFIVSQGNDFIYFETIITPNARYNQILWELSRTGYDYTLENFEILPGTYGRLSEITVESYTQLINVLDSLKSNNSYPNLKSLSKIGIQGPPSMLMCINKEQIRIGKSGIYEINNGIKINFIGFVPKSTLNNFPYKDKMENYNSYNDFPNNPISEENSNKYYYDISSGIVYAWDNQNSKYIQVFNGLDYFIMDFEYQEEEE